MDETNGGEEQSAGAEFAATVHFIDLWIRQKTDLFIQQYVFRPFQILALKMVCLAVLVTLLVAGTLVLLGGVILLLATLVPLWAAFLITALIIFLAGGVCAWFLFSRTEGLQTPTAAEVADLGKA